MAYHEKPGLAAWLGSHYPWPRTHEIAGSNPASPTIAPAVLTEDHKLYVEAVGVISEVISNDADKPDVLRESLSNATAQPM